MADTSIAVTSGSGNSIDMRSEATNGDLRQVIVIGDPSVNAGVAPVDPTYGLTVNIAPMGTVGDGRQTVTTAGTRVQLSSTSVPCKYVIITAEEDNTDTVVIGGSTCVGALATRRGIPLVASQGVRLEVSNLNLLYMDAIVSTEGVTYAYFV